MDNFTLAVVVGDVLVVVSLILLIVIDKGKPEPRTAEPARGSVSKKTA